LCYTNCLRNKVEQKLTICRQMNFSVGSFMAYWIGYACSKHTVRLGDWDWRTIIIFQLLAPILIIVFLSQCPESPRWFIKKDRVEDAVKTLSKIRADPEIVQHEVTNICRAIAYENEEISPGYSALWKDKSIRIRFSEFHPVTYLYTCSQDQCTRFSSTSDSN
jgi:hypothetical protein